MQVWQITKYDYDSRDAQKTEVKFSEAKDWNISEYVGSFRLFATLLLFLDTNWSNNIVTLLSKAVAEKLCQRFRFVASNI